MKKVIKQKELISVLKESIQKVLEENKKTLLQEMALQRKEYKTKVSNLIPQILENWCLVRYCTLSGGNPCKQHWIDELKGHLLTVSRFAIKGNDSEQARLKVIQEIWDDYDYSLPNFLNLTIANKFYIEGIDMSSDIYGQVLLDNIENTDEMFSAILSRDRNVINDYANSI